MHFDCTLIINFVFHWEIDTTMRVGKGFLPQRFIHFLFSAAHLKCFLNIFVLLHLNSHNPFFVHDASGYQFFSPL